MFEECKDTTSIVYSFRLIVERGVDALISSPCINAAVREAYIGKFYNTPILVWGQNFDSRFENNVEFPNVLNIMPTYTDLGTVICSIMKTFNWTLFSLIYQTDRNTQLCSSFQTELEAVTNIKKACTIGYKIEIKTWNPKDIVNILDSIQSTSRILLCFDDPQLLRRFSIELYYANMHTSEYVYLIPDVEMKIELNHKLNTESYKAVPFWNGTNDENNTNNTAAWEIAVRSFFVHVNVMNVFNEKFQNFSTEVIQRMSKWPFYCNDCANLQTSPYASTLYDVVYSYAYLVSAAMQKTNYKKDVYRNGSFLVQNDIKFEGLTGTVIIGVNGGRDATFLLSSYSNRDGSLVSYIKCDAMTENTEWLNNNSQTLIWQSRNYIPPLTIPLCGLTGNECPEDILHNYKGYFIAAAVLILAIIAGTIFIIYYTIKFRIEENKRQNELWQISPDSLKEVSRKAKNKEFESARSLQSDPSITSTKITHDSTQQSVISTYGITYMFDNKLVTAISCDIGIRLDKKDMAELRAMRLSENDNLNRFFGLTMDRTQTMSIWKYCSRGPLSSVIAGQSAIKLDGFIIYSLIRDICEGLNYIHNSVICWHGNLRSTNCLIDDRWQVKLSDFGLKFYRRIEDKETIDLLWTAPEHLRDGNYIGSAEGDVFSFAIVCSEAVNMRLAKESIDTKGDLEEVIYMYKKGGKNPFRPHLVLSSPDLNPALVHLIRDCWSENPAERPKIDTIKAVLLSMNTGKIKNLMDHVFSMLEQYTGSLEDEVEQRTKELSEEQKKTDILLYRMLPKQVADKLKLGQVIEPETYSNVTIFFSDVVSFTTLASRCTPLQVVNLLNNLYTMFDSIIAKHDVYKVETIGDGYLCVSGLPRRNGDEHARQIALMSLAFMRNVKTFEIPHLQDEIIRLRIGIHTGPCVTGVVGLSMPRFCLFGDTVNTASRMESNGKPMHIHISHTTNHYLLNIVGGFVTEPRGEVIIKGKGIMETFWLLGLEGDPNISGPEL